MPSLLLFVTILAFAMDGAFSSRQPSINKRLNMPSKNNSYHSTESREDVAGITIERYLRGLTAATHSPDPVASQTKAFYPKLLTPTSYPTTFPPASSNHPPSHGANSFPPAKANQKMIDDVIGLVEYEPAKRYTIAVHVFLIDNSTLMDTQTRNTFELAALKFIIRKIDKIDINIESISDVTVVDQRLTWSRLADCEVSCESSTGIKVYFTAGLAVSGDVEQQQVERAVQALFDSKSKSFRKAFNLALLGGPADEPEPTTFLLEPEMSLPIGLAATAAGCISLVAILIMSVYCINKYGGEERKELSQSSLEEKNSDDVVHEQPIFPFQQATLQQNWNSGSSESDNDVDDLSTFGDNTFDASLVFCPSVERDPKDASAYFDSDQSAIANVGTLTDSDNDESYEYSPIQQAQKTFEVTAKISPIQEDSEARLTTADLQKFDEEIRRAEC